MSIIIRTCLALSPLGKYPIFQQFLLKIDSPFPLEALLPALNFMKGIPF